jgi:methyl-accepting chemotaxis protein
MDISNPQFWMMVSSIVIAICFIIMAISFVAIAIIVKKVIGTANRIEARVDPLLAKMNLISDQGKDIAQQFNELSGHLTTATKNLSESTGLIRDEVIELKALVSDTAIVAKDKVALVSQTIDRTQDQVLTTTDLIQAKIVEPAREVAAIMAGFKKGLEVLLAPAPKPIDRVYTEDELFIG